MNIRLKRITLLAALFTMTTSVAFGGTPSGANFDQSQPTWLMKLNMLSSQNQIPVNPATNMIATSVGSNIDVSNERGPQSETSIAINPNDPTKLVAGSNEIFRAPMRGYFSQDGGVTWGGVDLPLPSLIPGANLVFGSDPSVAWDANGNVFYSYIVVFANRNKIVASEMAVAKSSDGGQTYNAVFFNFQRFINSKRSLFNDKPMITVDNNPLSRFKDTIYVAWDVVGSTNAILEARSADSGRTFSSPVVVSRTSVGIGADPFVSPDGALHVAWHDFNTKVLSEASSSDGGLTFGPTHAITKTNVAIGILIPADNNRGVLIYPACGADTSSGPNIGNIYCSWTDSTASNGLDVFVSKSTDGGATWSSPFRVNDDLSGVANDQFFNWLSVDPMDGSIHLSFYDTRNDRTRVSTDVFYSKSVDGGNTFSPNIKVTTATTDETSAGADLGNQYGDYEGIAAFGGVAHPIWTDRRASVIAQGLGEEVFTATIQ